ncbi:MAG TPA: hypothetical protein VJZ69_00085 [Clostridia bacterium]|nr:hypothetical protein [Clostridia bacterium]
MDNVTKAKINLFAVLRNIQDLCYLDSESQEIIRNQKISVQFNVADVGSATLKFADGKCEFSRGKEKASLKLWFSSPEHFNKLIDGEKTIPIFINIFQAGFLLNTFTKLAARLSYFLKPTQELLNDKDYFKINTYLTAYTAFFALCEIGNSDRIGKMIASRIPDGDIQLEVKEGPEMVLNIDKAHNMTARMGRTDMPRALMQFGALQTANDILNGKTDIFSCLGAGKFLIKGYLPMLDNMSKLLSFVSRYLA